MPGTDTFLGLKMVICSQFASGCVRFLLNSISQGVYIQMSEPATVGGGTGFRCTGCLVLGWVQRVGAAGCCELGPEDPR